MRRPARLGDASVADWLVSHRHWRLDGGHLVLDVVTRDYSSAVRLLEAQVPLCENLDHHPLVTLGFRSVRFELWTHDVVAITSLDFAYAEGLDAIIARDFSEIVVS